MAFRFFDKDGSLGIKPDEIADVTKMMGQELTAEEKQLLHQAVRCLLLILLLSDFEPTARTADGPC